MSTMYRYITFSLNLLFDVLSGVDVNNTHLSLINPDYNMVLGIFVRNNQYSAY